MSSIEADAAIIEVTSGVIRFRVPVDLLGLSDVPAPPLGTDPTVTLEIFSVPEGRLFSRAWPQPRSTFTRCRSSSSISATVGTVWAISSRTNSRWRRRNR